MFYTNASQYLLLCHILSNSNPNPNPKSNSLYLSHLFIFQVDLGYYITYLNVSILDFIGAKVNGVSGDSWIYK